MGSFGRVVAAVALVSALAGGAAITPGHRGLGGAGGTGTGRGTGGRAGGAVAALAALDDLPVRGRATRTGFARSRFGEAWADTDRNGCDTRDDVLRRDLRHAVVADDGCTVLAGTLTDPYTGAVVAYPAVPLQVDHVVPLGDAWVTGAQRLTLAHRTELANDPLNLLTTTARTSIRKNAADAAGWLPSQRSFRCAYVARQIAVKRAYGLWVTAAERLAMAAVLAGCPGAALPASDGAASPPSTPAPSDEPWSGPTAPEPSDSGPAAPDPSDTDPVDPVDPADPADPVDPQAPDADPGGDPGVDLGADPGTAAVPTAEPIVTAPAAPRIGTGTGSRSGPGHATIPRRTTARPRAPAPTEVPLG